MKINLKKILALGSLCIMACGSASFVHATPPPEWNGYFNGQLAKVMNKWGPYNPLSSERNPEGRWDAITLVFNGECGTQCTKRELQKQGLKLIMTTNLVRYNEYADTGLVINLWKKWAKEFHDYLQSDLTSDLESSDTENLFP